ncbi:MAG: efflux RND transporter permease subunit [Deltaproteobacteria bacterium]|nr:efflux RND transporter permease subunit [Deltaproteobacteria bacterium]
MNIVDFSLKHRTTILFLMFLLVVGGSLAYVKLGKLEDPVFTIKTAMVITEYPGASAHEVDQQVTRVVERAVQAADEVENIKSLSTAGLSILWVDMYEYNYTAKIQQLWDILRRRVAEAQAELPPGAGPPIVKDDYSDVFGIFLALTGDGFSYAELRDYADYLKRELVLVPQVKRINLYGVRNENVLIDISRAKCAGFGLSPTAIVQALQGQNQMLWAGALESGDLRLRLAEKGAFDSLDKIKGLIVSPPGDRQIRLEELAQISRGYEEPPEPMMRFNGKPAIGLAIAASHGANVVNMGEAVQARIDEMLQDMPVGLDIQGIYYQSEFVKSAIADFLLNLGESVAIVLAVLLLSMGLRSGLIISANLILSILATLVVMLVWGIDLQRISLASLILVMGMIVDNAIVVADGSLVRLAAGAPRDQAISQPAKQTALPLLGATIIAALAFMPIYLAPTNTGEYCASLFQVVAIALVASWVLAMSQTPVFCHYLLKAKAVPPGTDPFGGRFYRYYRGLLQAALRWRWVTLLIMLVLLAGGLAGFRFVATNFFADSDKAQFFIDYRLPEGSRLQALSADLALAEKKLASLPQLKNFAVCLGASPPRFAASVTPEPNNPSFGQVVVNVHDFRDIDGLILELEKWFAENLPQGEAHLTKYISGPKADYRVEARFTGPDPGVLRRLATEAKKIMQDSGVAKNVTDDWRQRVLVWNADYSQQRGRIAGVERGDLATALLGLTDGVTVTSFRENDKLIPIKVRLGHAGAGGLRTSPVWGQGGTATTVGQVIGRESLGWEDPLVRRYNRRRVIRAQCDPVAGLTSGVVLNKIRPAVEALALPTGYTLAWEGEKELSDKGNEGVNKFLPLALILMVIILVALFNAIRQPLIIILTIPLAIVGMSAGLLLTREAFGFLAILGAYSLIGMLIKNAVVLLDQIDLEIKQGKEALQAVLDSSVSRLRPVVLASGTTILGMIPLVGEAMFSSMAVTIMFGLAFSTVLILILVPVLYTLFFRIATQRV